MIDAFLFPDTVQVAKYLGPGGRGDAYADELDVSAEVKDEHSLVLDANGQEVTASATVTVPLETDVVLGSHVRLHKGLGKARGERVAKVLTLQRHDNPRPLPSHIVLTLT